MNNKIVTDIETGTVLERECFDYYGPIESCDPATIAGIISLAVTGVTTGVSLSNRPSEPKAPATPSPEQTSATATDAKKNQIAALTQAFPSIQQLTGGSLSPEAWLRLAEIISGQGGSPGIGAAEGDIFAKLTGGSNPLPFLVTAGNNPSGSPTTPSGLTPGGATP